MRLPDLPPRVESEGGPVSPCAPYVVHLVAHPDLVQEQSREVEAFCRARRRARLVRSGTVPSVRRHCASRHRRRRLFFGSRPDWSRRWR
jgi:hypothetical protein